VVEAVPLLALAGLRHAQAQLVGDARLATCHPQSEPLIATIRAKAQDLSVQDSTKGKHRVPSCRQGTPLKASSTSAVVGRGSTRVSAALQGVEAVAGGRPVALVVACLGPCMPW
jgi:hypothetical protein